MNTKLIIRRCSTTSRMRSNRRTPPRLACGCSGDRNHVFRRHVLRLSCVPPCALQRFAAASQQLSIKMEPSHRVLIVVRSRCFGRESGGGGQAQTAGRLPRCHRPAGLTFLVVKGFEYNEKFERHHVPGATFKFTDTFDDNGKQIPVTEGSRTLLLDLFCHDRHACPAHDHRLRPF